MDRHVLEDKDDIVVSTFTPNSENVGKRRDFVERRGRRTAVSPIVCLYLCSANAPSGIDVELEEVMGIKRHVAYGAYLLRHKWFVTIECFRHGLIWRGLVHDLSKFRPSEWFPYAGYFYAPDGKPREGVRVNSAGYYKPTDIGDAAFELGVLAHRHRNKHHWQWWVQLEDNGWTKVLQMPIKYVEEMICDWMGAERAQGFGRDIRPWYEKNKDKMKMHPVTQYDVGLFLDAWCNEET